MNDALILSDDDPYSIPSMPTMHGGDPAALGRIDHYDILCKLGGGGFGVVYLARDTASGVEVAIKTLHPLIKRNAEEMDLLREKFALVSRLAHPNIATALVLHPVRDIHVWDDAARAELKLSPGDSVMVMRYAPGVTLSKWRRQFPNGVVPPDLALEIGRQVAAALDYAHGERIVHRDIKPANIMVETLEGGRVRARILDFGLAAEIRLSMSRVSTEQGDTSGTRPYMAPEQWLGKKQDGRTDQYALACVLYDLLSGAPPFANVFSTGDPAIMERAVLGRAPDEIEDAVPAVNTAFLRALAKAPHDRFPTCAAFVAALSSTTDHTEGEDNSTNCPPSISDSARSPSATQDAATLEVDVLRRKVSLARKIVDIPSEDASHVLLGSFVREATSNLDLVEEACRFGRFSTAAACLDSADEALEKWRTEKNRLREETERAEAERRRLEEAARVRRAREDAERARREQAVIRRIREQAEVESARNERRFGLGCCIAIGFGILYLFWAILASHSGHNEAPSRYSSNDSVVHQESSTFPPAVKQTSPGKTESIDLGNNVKIEMLHCPGVKPGFWIGKYEVTQAQYQQVMEEDNSKFKGSDFPVQTSSPYSQTRFLEKLNQLSTVKSSGFVFRLPNEKEWEIACRAGAPTSANFCKTKDGTKILASTLSRVARFGKSYSDGPVAVGSFEPNAWGLYDMHGNVREWTQSKVGDDPVYRGGGYSDTAIECSASFRNWGRPEWNGSPEFGFRLAADGMIP